MKDVAYGLIFGGFLLLLFTATAFWIQFSADFPLGGSTVDVKAVTSSIGSIMMVGGYILGKASL